MSAAAARRGRIGRLLRLLPSWGKIFLWGAFSGARTRASREVHQAVVLRGDEVLLTLRPDLQGWELPGGGAAEGEASASAVVREVREETGLDVEVEALVGEYHRTGFAAHCARVWRCRVVGGTLRRSAETPELAWFDLVALPRTLLPWYRGPLADALARHPEPVVVHERQGLRAILAGMAIDLRVRWQGPARR